MSIEQVEDDQPISQIAACLQAQFIAPALEIVQDVVIVVVCYHIGHAEYRLPCGRQPDGTWDLADAAGLAGMGGDMFKSPFNLQIRNWHFLI